MYIKSKKNYILLHSNSDSAIIYYYIQISIPHLYTKLKLYENILNHRKLLQITQKCTHISIIRVIHVLADNISSMTRSSYWKKHKHISLS